MLIEFVVAFVIVTICVTIHIAVLLRLIRALVARKNTFLSRVGIRRLTLLLSSIFALMTVLHVIEACVWATFYWLYKLFPDWETSFYFSLGSYTTIGYGDVVLPRTWRLLGAIEGISGVLLCGLSTAVFFAIINALFRLRLKQLGELEK